MEGKGEMTLLRVFLVVVMATAVWATSSEIAQELMDSHMRNLQENRRTVKMLRDLLDDLDVNMQTIQKRTCYFNGGMAHSCDYKDVVGAVDEAKYWSSPLSPGKRRRRDADKQDAS